MGNVEKVVKLGLKREPNYIYYLDKDGDVSRAMQTRGRGKHLAVKKSEDSQ